MATVRLQPRIQDTSGVREKYESNVGVAYPTGLRHAADAITGFADTVMDLAARKARQEKQFKASITKADQSNSFTKYKNDLATIQKATFTDMSLAPDSENRKDLQAYGLSRIKELNKDYKYRKTQDAIDYTDTFTSNYNISSKGLWGKVEIEEQRFKLDAGTVSTLSRDIPPDIQIAEHTKQLLGNVEAGIISEADAVARDTVFKTNVDTRWITDNRANQYSDASIAELTQHALPTMTTKTAVGITSDAVTDGYIEQRDQIANSTYLSDEVKTKMLEDSHSNEEATIKSIDDMYDSNVFNQNNENETAVSAYLNATRLGEAMPSTTRSTIMTDLAGMEDQKLRATLERKLITGDAVKTDEDVRKRLTGILIRFEGGEIDAKKAMGETNSIITKRGKDMTLADMTKVRSTLSSIRGGNKAAYTQEGKNITMVNSISKDKESSIAGMLTDIEYTKEEMADKFEDIDDMDDLSLKEKAKLKLDLETKARKPKTDVIDLLNSEVYRFINTNDRTPTELEREELLMNVVMPKYTKSWTRTRIANKLYESPDKVYKSPTRTPVSIPAYESTFNPLFR